MEPKAHRVAATIIGSAAFSSTLLSPTSHPNALRGELTEAPLQTQASGSHPQSVSTNPLPPSPSSPTTTLTMQTMLPSNSIAQPTQSLRNNLLHGLSGGVSHAWAFTSLDFIFQGLMQDHVDERVLLTRTALVGLSVTALHLSSYFMSKDTQSFRHSWTEQAMAIFLISTLLYGTQQIPDPGLIIQNQAFGAPLTLVTFLTLSACASLLAQGWYETFRAPPMATLNAETNKSENFSQQSLVQLEKGLQLFMLRMGAWTGFFTLPYAASILLGTNVSYFYCGATNICQ